MNAECRAAFDKANELIEKRKERLGKYIQPDIHDLDSGILLQYFENWIDVVEHTKENISFNLKKRYIDIIDKKKIDEIYLSFSDDNVIENYEITHDKLFIMLDGNATFKDIETNEQWNLVEFSAKLFKKGQVINFYSKNKFNYFIVVKFKSPVI